MSALAALTDAEVCARLERAMRSAARTGTGTKARQGRGVAEEQATALRAEMGERIASGRWAAWHRLSIDVTPTRREADAVAGTCYRDSRGRWVAEAKVEGRRHRRIGATEAEARAALADVVHRVERGLEARTSSATVEEWMAHVAADVMTTAGLRPNTIAIFRHAMTHIVPVIGHRPIAKVRPADVRSVIAAMQAKNLSPNTIRLARSALLRAMKVAVEDGVIDVNPVVSVKGPRLTTRDATFLEVAEAQKVLIEAAADDYWGDAVALTLLLGLRRGEVLGLGWRDVDLDGDRATLRVRRQLVVHRGAPSLTEPKTDAARRLIVLPTAAVEVLRRRRVRQAEARLAAGQAWRNADDLVFTTGVGSALNPDNFAKATSALCRRAIGRHVHPHALRHSAATLMAAAGVPVKVAQEMLGHSSPVITLAIYSHVLGSSRDEAAVAIDRLLG